MRHERRKDELGLTVQGVCCFKGEGGCLASDPIIPSLPQHAPLLLFSLSSLYFHSLSLSLTTLL